MEFLIWIGVGIVAWMFLSELRDIKDHLGAIRSMMADEVRQQDGTKQTIKWISDSAQSLVSIEQERERERNRTRRPDAGA